VHGLLGDAQAAGDVLPGPAELTGLLDLEQFQPFGQRAQGHRARPDVGIVAGRAFCDLQSRFHAVSIC
jgi:hypothetical protein